MEGKHGPKRRKEDLASRRTSRRVATEPLPGPVLQSAMIRGYDGARRAVQRSAIADLCLKLKVL
jgi:hypothetical protein